MIIGAASSLADFAAARGRDYTSAANFPAHYPGFLENSRPGQPFGWAPLPSALHSMQGKKEEFLIEIIIINYFFYDSIIQILLSFK